MFTRVAFVVSPLLWEMFRNSRTQCADVLLEKLASYDQYSTEHWADLGLYSITGMTILSTSAIFSSVRVLPCFFLVTKLPPQFHIEQAPAARGTTVHETAASVF